MKSITKAVAVLCVCLGLSCSKPAIPATEFVTKARAAGFTVEEGTCSISSKAVAAYVAKGGGGEFDIQFFEFKTKTVAQAVFKAAQSTLEKIPGSVSSKVSVSVGNWGQFGRTIGGHYAYAAYIENTAVYALVNERYKTNIQTFMKELGY
jgi:hypothetical protein